MSTLARETESAPAPRRSGRRRTIRAAAALAVLVLLAAAAWWFNRPPTLLGQQTAGGFAAAPEPLDSAALAMGITSPDLHGADDETLTFTSAVARLTTNTAHSTAEVVVCERRRGQLPILAAPARQLSTYCSQVRPIEDGTTVRWTDGPGVPRYLVVILTPRTVGTTRLRSVTFDYARDWRHGHAHGKDVARSVHVSLRATR